MAKRKVIEQKTFNEKGTFKAMYAAQSWLRSKGYDYGSTSAIEPTAVMKGDYYSYGLPHKMKNFSAKDKASIHGIITGEMREGPVTVKLYN